MMGNLTCSRLCVWGLGIALGLTNGLGMLVLGLAGTYYNMGNELINQVGTIYTGYDATVRGSFIGFGWGLLDGFICGVVIGLIYNLVVRYCCNRV